MSLAALHRLERVTAAGTSALVREGTGLPVVLLHGIGSRADSFLPLIDALPGDVPVVAWDAPGYGASAPLAMEWPSAVAYADRLAALFDALGMALALVLGHSLGALVACAFALEHPTRVEGLLLASPATGYGGAPGAPMPAVTRDRLAELEALGAPAFAARRAARLVADADRQADVVAAVTRAMASVSLPGYAQATRMLTCGRLVEDAGRLAVPTLVLVGTRDVVTPPEKAEAVTAALPLAHACPPGLVRVEGAGHAVTQERPDAVTAALARLAAFAEARA